MANKVEYTLTGNTKKLQGALAEADRAVGAMSEGMRKNLTNAGQALSKLGGAAGALSKNFQDAYSEVEALEIRLRGAFDPTQAAAMTATVQQLAVGTRFTADQFGTAAVKLKQFGLDSEANLKLVGDMASKLGIDVPQAASLFAQAQEGNRGALKALEKQFGITKEELAAFGGDFKAFAEANFSGSMEATKDAGKELEDELKILRAEFGKAIDDNVVGPTEDAMLALVRQARELPGPVKAVIGVSVDLVGKIGSIGGPALQAAANLSQLSGGLKTAAVSAKAFLVANSAAILGIAGAAAILIATAVAAQTLANQWRDAAQAADDLVDADAALKGMSGNAVSAGNAIAKTAEELKKMGVNSRDVKFKAIELRRALEEGSNLSDEQRAKLQKDIAALQEKSAALSRLEKAEKEAQKAAQDRAKADLQAMKDEAASQKAPDLPSASPSAPEPQEPQKLAPETTKEVGAQVAKAIRDDGSPSSGMTDATGKAMVDLLRGILSEMKGLRQDMGKRAGTTPATPASAPATPAATPTSVPNPSPTTSSPRSPASFMGRQGFTLGGVGSMEEILGTGLSASMYYDAK